MRSPNSSLGALETPLGQKTLDQVAQSGDRGVERQATWGMSDKMARITFVLPRFHTNMWFAVRAMLAEGHELQLLTNSSGVTKDTSLCEPVVMGKYPSYKAVASEIDDFDPDIVFVRNAWALSRRAAVVSRRRRVPSVLYNQIPVDVPTNALRRLELSWKRLPKHRITPVKNFGDIHPEMYATYLPWPVSKLPCGISDVRKDDRLRVLLVGKLGTARKNQDKLIEAIAASELTSKISLTLVGSLAKKGNSHFERLLALSQLEWIEFRGHVPFLDMPSIYSSHDVCVLPSFAEPLGTSPVEAMAYGTVPVISRECGSARYLTHGQDGFVFNPDRMEELLEILGSLSENRLMLGRMKSEASATADNELGEAKFIQRMNQLLSSYLG